ncbi:MAG TPA: DUF4129 domain-containing protein [Planctomycetota bacterium]|nr:DUF4129 domain-containing protein [Planctomycetota bacterium]
MRRQPNDLLRARLLALFLLSLGAVYGSILAWKSERATSLLFLLWPPLLLGAAALGGASIHERLAGLVDAHVRGRVRSAAGIVYGAILLLLGLGLLVGHRAAGERGLVILQGLQAVFLLLAGFGRGYLGTLVNAFALTVASILAGGTGAAVSATLLGGLLAFFLVVDHAARKLTEYPVESLPPAGPILARGALQALAIFAVLAGWFVVFPAAPYARLARAASVTIPPDKLAGLLGNLLFLAVGSAIAFYLALRLGGGSAESSEDVKLVAHVPARRRSQPVTDGSFVERTPTEKPWSVRIVKLYCRTTEQLARWGRRRRSFQTPREYAGTLAPAGAALELTELFSRARYGREELSESDFERASQASREILDHHRRRS